MPLHIIPPSPLSPQDGYLYPSTLGLALAEACQGLDLANLVLPHLRSEVGSGGGGGGGVKLKIVLVLGTFFIGVNFVDGIVLLLLVLFL